MWSPQRQEGPTRLVGPAYTVKYVRKNHDTDPILRGHYVSLLQSCILLSPLLVDVVSTRSSNQSVLIPGSDNPFISAFDNPILISIVAI